MSTFVSRDWTLGLRVTPLHYCLRVCDEELRRRDVRVFTSYSNTNLGITVKVFYRCDESL